MLNNVRNPVQTLKIAGPLGLGICTLLYILANVAYFAAATKTEIEDSGVTVAALFFENVFGTTAERALSVFIALSALGNVITVTFAAARVNQELAKEGIPLPLGNKFWASNWPTGKSPLPGLIVHLIPSVIVILGPPMSVAYPFILDVEGYPMQIINFFIVIGLFYLRWKKPDLDRPFKDAMNSMVASCGVLFRCSNVSDDRPFSTTYKRCRRYPSSSILSVLPRWYRSPLVWSSVLGGVACPLTSRVRI